MKEIPEQSAQMRLWRRTDWAFLGLLLCLVTLAWCSAYNRWTAAAWNTPIYYGSDAWGTLAGAKAFSTGEIPPILSKHPASLGAPFQANWDDYPTVEEGIWVWVGLLVRVFGLFRGTNCPFFPPICSPPPAFTLSPAACIVVRSLRSPVRPSSP
ncbi:MAG: hypothetical protein M3N12_09045 [Verrucomicrobiota bacterium]|nr:hypothetical protein [Verrucomicrobiota bacterium]